VDRPGEGPAPGNGGPRVRIGILGGTFNPPHAGHIALARAAKEEFRLDRVLLMPAGKSPGKAAEEEPNPAHPEHRLAMCRLAAEGVAGVEVSAKETERGGESYTVDTLRAVHAEHGNIEITFILGADVAETLPSWHESHALPALARFAVASRPGAGNGTEDFPVDSMKTAVTEVSSSEVRERIRKGDPVDGLVGGAVAAYIAQHGLYGAPEGVSER
jgi:nicotinate-nucleotide adenylyltransferase